MLRLDTVRERRGRVVECSHGLLALGAVREMLLELLPLVCAQRVERVGGAQIMELVVRHLLPFAGIRRGRQIGSTYSRGGFWTLCSFA